MFGNIYLNLLSRHVLSASIFFGLMFPISSAVGQQKKIDDILTKIEAEIQHGRHSTATQLLRAVDLSEIDMSKNRNREVVMYLAVRGYGTVIPGIPSRRARTALTNLRVTFIPGTTDYSKNDDEVEFQAAAVEFAAKFNMYARHFGTVDQVTEGEVELSTVCKELSLTKKEWECVPLFAKLKIRNLIEQLVENELDEQVEKQRVR